MMNINISQDNLLYWPLSNLQYSADWKFTVEYEVPLSDGQKHSFISTFYFNSVDKEIYYVNFSVRKKVQEINWNYNDSYDEKGNVILGDTQSFIFYKTKYAGPMEIADSSRENVFSNSANPLNWDKSEENNVLNKNRDLLAQWWIENAHAVRDAIVSRKDEFNSMVLKCANEILIK